MQFIDSASELAKRYPVWFCDVWGVVHDGVRQHPRAVQALRRFRERGGCVMLLTNAPRPAPFVEQRLAALGIDGSAYDAVITSGDVTHELLAGNPEQGLLYIGPDSDLKTLGGLEHRLVDEERAGCILGVGLVDDEHETAEDYRVWFERLVARGLPFFCANPDLVVQRGDRLMPCAGALAELYGELGGEVVIAGKPYAPIYDRAAERVRQLRGQRPDPASVLAIGDGLPTDMTGAARQGLDALFILDGIHAEELGVEGDRLDGEALEAISKALRDRIDGLNCIAVMRQLE